MLAALALIPRGTRIPVLVCWMVALGTAVLAAGLGLVVFDFPTLTTGPGLGFLVVLLQAFFLVAAVIGLHGFLQAIPPAGRWRRPAAATAAVLLSLVPALGLAWFAIGGHSQLGDEADTGIPAYMVQNAELNMAKIPDQLDDEGALFATDIMSTGFAAIENAGLRFGDSVAVFAQGPVGLCVTAAARTRGAGLIVTVESIPSRVAISRRQASAMSACAIPSSAASG